jgi:glutaminase A
VGDWQHPFLLQSISKVFVYGMALEDRGREFVQRRVDVEPTGDPFDAIIKLEHKSKRPFNPMVNTGGIATTSLIQGQSRAHRLQRILRMYARYVGQEVRLDAPALLAEQSGGDRNRAISYLLRHFGMVHGAVEDALDLYLQQCSAIVTARDLAVMAATLAAGGTNPLTGERAISRQYVKDLLSVMYTCGMYDFAGAWAYQVGLPAKSGVGGGIMAVVPGEMGIAVFSPPLDERGNSVRGIRVFEELSQRLKLHTFEPIRN